MNDDLFDYLVATDTIDEFLGYKGLDNKNEVINEEDNEQEDSNDVNIDSILDEKNKNGEDNK